MPPIVPARMAVSRIRAARTRIQNVFFLRPRIRRGGFGGELSSSVLGEVSVSVAECTSVGPSLDAGEEMNVACGSEPGETWMPFSKGIEMGGSTSSKACGACVAFRSRRSVSSLERTSAISMVSLMSAWGLFCSDSGSICDSTKAQWCFSSVTVTVGIVSAMSERM